jgi:hypothetical protein
MSFPRATTVGERTLEMARALTTLLLVLGTATAALSGLDSVPGWIQGQPRGVRRVASVEEAERRLKARLFLPAYFPDTLRWPPALVRMASEPTASVALTFEGRDGGVELQLAQTVGGDGRISPLVLAPVTLLQSSPLSVGAGEGTLARIVGEDGTIWHQVEWVQSGQRLALRGRRPVEELVRMARSARREGP